MRFLLNSAVSIKLHIMIAYTIFKQLTPFYATLEEVWNTFPMPKIITFVVFPHLILLIHYVGGSGNRNKDQSLYYDHPEIAY